MKESNRKRPTKGGNRRLDDDRDLVVESMGVEQLSVWLRMVLAAHDAPQGNAALALLHAAGVIGQQVVQDSANPKEALADFDRVLAFIRAQVADATAPGLLRMPTPARHM